MARMVLLVDVQCRLTGGKVSNPRSRIQDPGLMNDSVLEFTTTVFIVPIFDMNKCKYAKLTGVVLADASVG